MSKEKLLGYLDEAENILEQNQIANDILQPRFSERRKDLENFSAKILFVGEFSAGKSALLNSFLGDEEILRENIAPETAVAAELLYGSPEKIICVNENGQQRECSFQDRDKISSRDCSKCVYFLDNVRLKKLNDLIPVDMPGFDSGIEAHNKALMQYLGDAAAYVFVVDLEKGTVGQSSLDFLDEIRQYSNSIAFVLTKRDKLSPSDVEKVTQNIETTLENVLGEMPPVIVTSIRDSDCGEKLADLLGKFSADELLMQKFGDKIILLFKQSIQSMEMQLSALEFNSHDIDREIQNQERQKDSVAASMQREKKNLHNSLQNEVPQKILQDVENALRSQIGALIHSARQGNEAFNSAVNNIIRPVILQSTQRNIDASFENYIDEIINRDDSLNPDEAENKIRKTFDAVKGIAESGKVFAKAKKYKDMYQIFSTGLALTTSVVAPWLELIIIFLPNIIGVLNDLIGRSKEEKLRSCIEYEIIPQICEKLRPEIREALSRVEEERLAEIEDEFQSTLDNEINALQQLKAQKEQHLMNVDRKKADLSQGIDRLKEIVAEIENA